MATHPPAPETPQAVVVLGAQVFADGRPSSSLRRRVDRALAVMADRNIPYLIGCGGTGDAPVSEAAVIEKIAVDAGIAPDRVLIEDASTTTLEHAVNVRPMVGERGWSRLVIVTDRFHLPRALFLFRRAGLDVEGVASARGDGSLRRWVVEGYLREIPAWVKALWDVARGRAR